MSMIRSGNPVLSSGVFGSSNAWGNLERDAARPKVMTMQGAANATMILLGITVGAAIVAWTFMQSVPGFYLFGTLGGSLGGLALVLIACMFPRSAPWVAVPVAICEGFLAGGLSIFWSTYSAGAHTKSGIVENLGTGLVIQASLLTVGIAGGMLIAYSTRLIPMTQKVKMGIVAATMGIFFVSMISLLLSFFGVRIPYIWDNGIIGIGFAAVVVVIAALNLLLDFDFIEQGAERGLPKHMEWVAAIGLLVTLVWLYISILRLLAQLNRR